MVTIKTYTPEERDQRRRRTSIVLDSPAVNDNENLDFNESWFEDLRAEGIDIDEFLKDVIPPSAETSGDASRDSSNIFRRMSKQQQAQLFRRISSSSTSRESVKQRLSSFFGQSYEFHPVTGEAMLRSPEEMEEKNWQREREEDSRYFDPQATSSERRVRNKQWAIDMALRRVAEAGFEPEVKKEETVDYQTSDSIIETNLPPPPPIQTIPPVEEFNLDSTAKTSLGPRNVGIFPPPLPHNISDVIPKLSRFDLVGISDGETVTDTLGDAWRTCDSTTMIVACMNSDSEKCAFYLRCPRSASLVRCPRCNIVSPVSISSK
ncbi:hypothetical protein HJC23_010758 [Cyclotella cryptica]|uniref:Uncharacterized protein n=1 Tax=Cyclotella cryptica TaxID=29204 RepID=A0ABD3PVH8_9STRA|eukprot:CCRYP_011085-RA/>CCRYP_011085-RA protein AED:0.35 eAED:0.35 QI:0/-1/0/1/-1/1/1/0/319